MLPTPFKVFVFVASLLATFTAVRAQEPPAAEHKWKDKTKGAVSSPLAPIKTMPPGAIVVLDPGVDPKGDPKPLLRKTPDGSGLTVEIPETVHVHRYFPCGVREFQAQYFAGGPTIVSVRHPYSGERVYVHTELAPGFPVVRYEEDKIEYKYPEETFAIHFAHSGGVSTSYSGCPAAKKRCKECAKRLKGKTLDCTDQLGVNKLVTTVGKETCDLTHGAVATTGVVVKQSADIFKTAVNLVPGAQALKSAAGDRAVQARDRAVSRVAEKRTELEADIRTNR